MTTGNELKGKLASFFNGGTDSSNEVPPLPRKTDKINDIERKDILERELQKAIIDGFRIESRTDTSAVIVRGKSTNHFIHLIMFVVTATFWWPVWLFFTIKNRIKRQLIVVDECGNVDITDAKK